MVIKNKIYKIGSCTTGFKARVGSYNCGKQKARNKGTCSTTNYFVLQTLLNFNVPVEIYGLFSKREMTFMFLGSEIKEAFPSAKNMKNILLVKFKKKYNKLPIACAQQ